MNFHRLRFQIEKLPGDILLISCFVSYVGGFTPMYRHELQEFIWKPAFRELKVNYITPCVCLIPKQILPFTILCLKH